MRAHRVLSMSVGWLGCLAAPALASEGGTSLHDFGWAWFNLLLLVSVIVYFGRKHLPDLMAVRRAGVRDEIEAAVRLLADAEARLGEWQGKVDSLEQEVERLRQESRNFASAEGERIIEQAQRIAERIRAEGKAAALRELEHARAELRAEAAHHALGIARQLLSEKMTDEDRARLLDGFVTGLERSTDSSPNGAQR